jgi:thioesterase domain-containing protein
MSAATALLDDASYGAQYLRRRIRDEFPLARHIGIEVEYAADDRLVLTAPFEPNANHNGTAFGGSQFCIAVLTGWAWATRYLAARQVTDDSLPGSRARPVARRPATAAARGARETP